MLKAGNVTVAVNDFERALDFYTKTLGLQLKYRLQNHWAEVGTEGVTIGIHQRTPEMPPAGGPGSFSVGFIVDAIEPAVARLKERGVAFHGPVTDTDFVKMAFFGDPDGNPHYLCQVKPAAMGGECGAEGAHEKAHAEAKPAKKAKAAKPKAKAKK